MIIQEELPMLSQPIFNDLHLEEMIYINALFDAVNKQDLPAITEHLLTLLEHSKTHFNQEEKLMQKHNFEGYYEHKAEHDRQLHELEHIIQYFGQRQDPQAIAAYIEGNLKAWTLHHIKTMDTALSTFLQNHN